MTLPRLPDRPCDPPEVCPSCGGSGYAPPWSYPCPLCNPPEEHLDVVECPLCEGAGFPAGILVIDGENRFCPRCNLDGRGITVTLSAEGRRQKAVSMAHPHSSLPSADCLLPPEPRAPTHGDLCLKLTRAIEALTRIAQYASRWDFRGRPVNDVRMIGGEAEQALADIQ